MNYFAKHNNRILIEKSLPHNFLAEKMLLSCLIYNPGALDITNEMLSSDAFYFRNHQELYKSLLIMSKNQLSIDIVTLTSFLQDNGLLSKIGGIKVLLDLGNQIYTFSSLNEYIIIIKEKFLKRCLIKFGYKIINSGYTMNQSVEIILEKIEQELFELINEIRPRKIITTSTSQLLNNMFLELKEKSLNPQISGLTSGFTKLDELTQGFQKSDLIIIAGRPSMGKTALSLSLTLNCIKLARLPVLLFSLEMSKEQIIYRILSTETGINQMNLRNGKLTKTDWIKLNKIMRIIAKLPLFIDDISTLSVNEVRSKLNSILLEQNQVGLVIIDYLQLMQDPNFKSENRVQELSQITRQLKSLARDFNIPIVALSQLSRNVDNRLDQRPILSDLRESGSIEQDADLVLMLCRSRLNSQKNYKEYIEDDKSLIIEIIIAKHRNGPTGKIKLRFNKNRMNFTEVD